MNVDQALQELRGDLGEARDAVQWALDHWDEASDRLLGKLRAVCANLGYDREDGRFTDGDAFTLYYLVHLFAEKRDKRAYAPLCERLRHEKNLDNWMGDAASGELAGVLISLYDGDLEPIQRIIETSECDDLSRTFALGAFSYLVRFEHALSDAASQQYLHHLYEKAEPRGADPFWIGWAETAARLGYSDLASDAARLFSKSWIDLDYLTIQDFHSRLAEARSVPKRAFEIDGLKPFTSTIELIDSYLSPAREEKEYQGLDTPLTDGAPFINPLRDVGRNDPCPCGSGKKYKKCCLAA
jgi:uncharacterized protein